MSSVLLDFNILLLGNLKKFSTKPVKNKSNKRSTNVLQGYSLTIFHMRLLYTSEYHLLCVYIYIYIYIYIYYSLQVFHISINWWSFTGVWVIANLQDSHQYSSWPQRCCHLHSLCSSSNFSSPLPKPLFQVHQLVSSSPSIAFFFFFFFLFVL